MIRGIALGALITMSACSPVDPPLPSPSKSRQITLASEKIQPPSSQKPRITSPPTPPTKVIPPQRILPLSYRQTSRSGITLSMVVYDDRKLQLRVADQPKGLGSRWLTAKDAANTYDGVAAINGGFFTPEGKPLGIIIETGTKRGYLNQSSLGAGLFISSNTHSALIRREVYSLNKTNAYNLLQTGPMLAENGKTISGLSKNNRRPRSFIAWDGKHHWMIGHASACTLNELSSFLAGQSLAGFKIKTAINLDGGRSSDLWASSRIPGGGKSHRGFLNKPVRNYLVLIQR